MHAPSGSDGTVDAAGDIEFLRQTVQCGHCAGGNRRDLNGHFGLLLMLMQDVIDAAEVSEQPNVRLAVFPIGFDDAVVLDTVRLVSLKRGQQLRIYMNGRNNPLRHNDFQGYEATRLGNSR